MRIEIDYDLDALRRWIAVAYQDFARFSLTPSSEMPRWSFWTSRPRRWTRRQNIGCSSGFGNW